MSGTDQNQKRHNQQYHVTLSRFNEILVDELRKLGSPLANYVKESGFGSRGYDKSAKAIDRA
ncbi:MAG TPA: hypothetical protein VFI73_01840, partial [Candidatus Nitrosopolaris sp.]|nr:hypothetical protein [Candidatus Nitrosopolaris sp.]